MNCQWGRKNCPTFQPCFKSNLFAVSQNSNGEDLLLMTPCYNISSNQIWWHSKKEIIQNQVLMRSIFPALIFPINFKSLSSIYLIWEQKINLPHLCTLRSFYGHGYLSFIKGFSAYSKKWSSEREEWEPQNSILLSPTKILP